MTMDSIQYKRSSPWNPGSQSEHQAEYLKRLNKLRADLIGQEESNLAHALERIRQSSNISVNSFSKTLEPRPTGSRRRQMLSTYEQFKLMRPVKPPVFIFPLQGHQLFDTPRTIPTIKSERKRTENRKRVDETVKLNLERIKHPLSSIPSLRKAVKLNELVLDTNDISISINPSEKYSYRTRGSRAKINENSMFPAFKTESLNKEHRQNYRRPNSLKGIPLPSISVPRGDGRPNFQSHLKVNTSPRSDLSAGTCSYNSVLHPQTEPLPRIQKSALKSESNPVTHRQQLEEQTNSSTAGEETARKYIRVDMPNIIYNCPTFDMDDRADDTTDPEMISKMYKQNDLQQKELQCLLHDVRELNNRTDSLIHLESKLFQEN